ncbi:putative type VI secretion system protein [Escherichia coli]|uniref:Putative type VI secretion system protein n=1 Tax=Escherichia coli TaxID=562 RepID=A0A376VRG6_ECOLX|nr:putative type VI secretion system protein [Escherichia coli]
MIHQKLNHPEFWQKIISLFCQSLNIADDRSVRTMTLILLKKNIIDLRYIPDDWYEQLSNQSYPGHIRVHELAQQELGFIPQ